MRPAITSGLPAADGPWRQKSLDFGALEGNLCSKCTLDCRFQLKAATFSDFKPAAIPI
jgi:hypothetical protein